MSESRFATRRILGIDPGLRVTGFGVLEALSPEEIPAVVFVTAFDQYAVRAFEAQAVDYLMKPFSKERVATLKLAQGDADMRAHAAQHPGFGMIDTYGWMLFLSGHTERHTLQIDEVKANPDFPK